jgi:hypothetical protein
MFNRTGRDDAPFEPLVETAYSGLRP